MKTTTPRLVNFLQPYPFRIVGAFYNVALIMFNLFNNRFIRHCIQEIILKIELR